MLESFINEFPFHLQTGQVEIPGLTGMGTDYYPYVFYKISLDLVDPMSGR